MFVYLYQNYQRPIEINGHSMEPTLYDGEYYFVKLDYHLESDTVVVYKPPKNTYVEYVGRIIAYPGDKLRIENGIVYRNDKLVNESYLSSNTKTNGGPFLKEGESYSVPQNNLIIFGDNRENSYDSRAFGFVPKENVIGTIANCYFNCH